MDKINCRYATRIEGRPASACTLGLHAGAPTFGQCVNYCDRREAADAAGPVIIRTTRPAPTRGVPPLPRWDESTGEGVEVERARAKQGGCCGAVAKAD